MRENREEAARRFRQCFEDHSKLVYSVAYSFMKNSADANDAMQEVFLKFYQHIDKFTDEEHIKRWLVTVTANTCRNSLRSGWFSRTIVTESSDEAIYNEDFGEESNLFEAVMSLPEKERVPLHLFYYEGCSTAEISKLLSLKESTIRVRIMRGRDKLKKILKEEAI